MDDLEKDLMDLAPEEQRPDPDDELGIFRSAFNQKKEAKKRKKKDKLFSDIDNILENSDELDQMMIDVMNFKPSKKKHRADGDLFDTKDKGSKKLKSIEAKFKPELANLQKILRDNEGTVKMIQDVLKPLLSSKARGSSKLLADLLMTLNSANNNRLSTIKEISSVKKGIFDLKLKMEKDKKAQEEGLPMDQFGSQIIDELFRRGRKNVLDEVNNIQPEYNVIDDDDDELSFDEIAERRLATEDTSNFRSDDAMVNMSFEARKPELCVQKSFTTGELSVVAIDSNGVVIDGYRTPTIEQLGKLTFNNDTHTCTDVTGRTFKVIEIN